MGDGFDEFFDEGDDEFFAREHAQDLRMEREEQEMEDIRDLQERGERLTLEDCANPGFDKQRPVQRRLSDGQLAYEWVTVTDQFAQVGITYTLLRGELSITAFEPLNAKLFEGAVQTYAQFDKAMKAADRKRMRLIEKGRSPAPKPRKKLIRHK